MNKLSVGVYEFLGIKNSPVFINILKNKLISKNIDATIIPVSSKDESIKDVDIVLFWCSNHIHDEKSFVEDEMIMLEYMHKAVIGCWRQSNAYNNISSDITENLALTVDDLAERISTSNGCIKNVKQ